MGRNGSPVWIVYRSSSQNEDLFTVGRLVGSDGMTKSFTTRAPLGLALTFACVSAIRSRTRLPVLIASNQVCPTLNLQGLARTCRKAGSFVLPTIWKRPQTGRTTLETGRPVGDQVRRIVATHDPLTGDEAASLADAGLGETPVGIAAICATAMVERLHSNHRELVRRVRDAIRDGEPTLGADRWHSALMPASSDAALLGSLPDAMAVRIAQTRSLQPLAGTLPLPVPVQARLHDRTSRSCPPRPGPRGLLWRVPSHPVESLRA